MYSKIASHPQFQFEKSIDMMQFRFWIFQPQVKSTDFIFGSCLNLLHLQYQTKQLN